MSYVLIGHTQLSHLQFVTLHKAEFVQFAVTCFAQSRIVLLAAHTDACQSID